MEVLEQRAMLAVDFVDLAIPNNSANTLRFKGAFDLDSQGFYEATNTVLVGYTPVAMESFKPLFSIHDGTVDLPGPNTADQTKFSFEGTIGILTSNSVLDVFATPDNNQFTQIQIAALAGSGVNFTADPLKQGVQNIPVASIPFALSSLAMNNPGGGNSTTESRVGLQGMLAFDQLKLNGLSVGVFGDNHVYVDGSDVTLTGVDASITTDFTTAGVGFQGELDVSYTTENDQFSFAGGVQFKTDDGGMNGVAANVELVVSHGGVSSFDVRVSGTFPIFVLSVTPTNLTFEYDVTNDTFEMFGKLAVNVSGTKITADMGTASNPGLVVQDAGGIQQVNMGLSGNFTLYGLGIQIPSNNPLTLQYHKSDSEYLISGEIRVPDFFSATTTLGTSSQPGLVIKEGEFKVDAFGLSLSDVNLGAFTIKQFAIDYAVTPSATTYGVTLSLKFPENWEVAGTIIVVDNKIHEISVEYQADSPATRIAIGDTGLFLTEIDATVQNIDHPDDLVVSGHMVTEFGKPVTIFGETVTMFHAEGTFSVDQHHLTMEADVWLGGVIKNGKVSGLLGSGNGQLLLDWQDGVYSITMHASLVDGTYTFDATAQFNNNLQLWIAAHASVNVPHSIPLIGGSHLGSMDFRLAFDPNDVANSYVAAWTKINLGFTKPTIGVEYLFEKKEAKVLGSHGVNKIKHDPFDQQDDVKVYSADFDVPTGATTASFSADFASNAGTQTISVTPPGGSEIMVNSSTPASTGITVLDDLDSPTSFNFSVVDPSNTANPPNVLLPTGKYTVKLYSKNYEFDNPSVNVTAIVDDGNGNTEVIFESVAKGIQVGNTLVVADNQSLATGESTPYNTDHVVRSVSSDGLSAVTDQPFDKTVGNGAFGTASGWQQPVFSATFLSPPPTFTGQSLNSSQGPVIDGVLALSNPILNATFDGTVDRAFADSDHTTVDVFVDSDDVGYDGVLLQGKVPATFDSGTFSASVQGDVSELPPGTYYIYAVVNDGTNNPVYSSYSSAFSPHHFIDGTIANQLAQPQAGWTAFADLNQNGMLEANEPVSQPSNSAGQYHFADVADPYATVFISTNLNEQNPRAYVYFPTANHNLRVGDRLLLTGSSVPAYNTSFRVTAVFPGEIFVQTDQAWVANADDIQADLLYQANPLPSIRSIRESSDTMVLAEFGLPHNLQVGNRFLVSGGSIASYNTIHTVQAILNATQVSTDQPFSGNADNLAGSTLAQPIPINKPFDVVIGPLPDGFELGADGGVVHDLVYDGQLAAQADLTVMEKAAIRGNVFTDLSHDGVRVAPQPIGQFDFGTSTSPLQTGYTRVTPSTTYSASQGYGWLDTSSNPVHDNDGGTGPQPTDLTRDANAGPEITFQVDAPNGVYDVTLWFGDQNSTHDQVAVFLQGTQIDTVTTDAGHFVSKTYTNIVARDEVLTLQLTDLGGTDPNARINGMSITRIDDPPLDSWTVELLQNGAVVASTLSGTDGVYDFSDLDVGDYNVRLIPRNSSAATYSFEASSLSGATVGDVSGSPRRDQQQGTLKNGASPGTASSFGISDRPNAGSENEILRVDGANQYMEVLSGSNLTPGTGAFSFGGWIRVDDPTKSQDIAGVNDPQNSNDGWAFRISHEPNTSGRLSVVLRQNGSGASLEVGAGPVLEAYRWYHVAFTYDPSVVDGNGNVTFDAVKIYVDGQLQTNTIPLNNNLPPNPDISTLDQINLNIGARGSQGNQSGLFFGGFLDEMSVWNSALSDLQIQVLSTGQTSPSYAQVLPTSPETYTVSIKDDFDVHDKVDFGVEEFLAVGGSVQGHSLNSRNLLNPTAQPLANRTVKLLNSDGTPVVDGEGNQLTALTQADGRYLFPTVPTGTYILEEVVSAGWRQISPSDAPLQFSAPLPFAPVGTSASSVTAADFDRDGHVDLAFSLNGLNEVIVHWGQGNGVFGTFVNGFQIPFSDAVKLVAVDFNGNGNPDLAVIGMGGDIVALLNNSLAGNSRNNLFALLTTGWHLPANSLPVDVGVGDFDGDSRHDLVVSHTALNTSSPSIAQFDFGTSSSALESGFIRMTGSTSYSASAGYGWADTNAVTGDDGGGGVDPKNLTRDGNNGEDIKFLFDLPNGVYGVSLWYGAKDGSHETQAFLQGTQVDNVTTGKNEFVSRTYDGIVVSNGQLIVRLINGANFKARINGLRITNTPGITFLPGNFGKATHHYVGGRLSGGVAVGFLNNDAFLDVALNAGHEEEFTAAFGDGHGGFPTLKSVPDDGTIVGLETGGPISLSDVNRDGLLDLVYPEGQSFVSGLYLDTDGKFEGNGFGVYSGTAVNSLRQIATDLNGDLRPDIAIAPDPDSNHLQQIRVLQNALSGPSLFNDPKTLGGVTGTVIDLIASDVNGDSLLDLIALEQINNDVGSLVFLNQSNASNTRIDVDLLSGVESSANDFLIGQISQTYGIVFDDTNGDGQIDSTERGRAGVTVYIDRNMNGRFDSASEVSTTTDASGSYDFGNLADGTYRVRLADDQQDFVTSPANAFHELTVLRGAPSTTDSQDFGVARRMVNSIADQITSELEPFSFSLARTDAATGRKLVFSLDASAPSSASIDPMTGRFQWNGESSAGIFWVTARVTDAAVPTLTQSAAFHIVVKAADGSLPVDGTSGSDDLTIHNDRIELNGEVVDTSGIRALHVFPGPGDDHLSFIVDGAIGPSQITVDDPAGDDTYAFSTSQIRISIKDDAGIDTLDFSGMESGIQLDLRRDRGRRVMIGDSRVRLGLKGTIENVTGTAHRDSIGGNSSDNVIRGGAGNDLIRGFRGNDQLDGQDGNDRLLGHRGRDMLFGGDGRDFLVGGRQADLLDGGADDDVLRGQHGRDLLIGGLGRDRLSGGNHDDVLIGGTTAADGLELALQALLMEWTSHHSYEQRTANIRGDENSTSFSRRRNEDSFLIANRTVFDDGQPDLLFGQLGRDWYFAHLTPPDTDVLPGWRRTEDVDLLDSEDPQQGTAFVP